jgi:hypothetical protein
MGELWAAGVGAGVLGSEPAPTANTAAVLRVAEPDFTKGGTGGGAEPATAVPPVAGAETWNEDRGVADVSAGDAAGWTCTGGEAITAFPCRMAAATLTGDAVGSTLSARVRLPSGS